MKSSCVTRCACNNRRRRKIPATRAAVCSAAPGSSSLMKFGSSIFFRTPQVDFDRPIMADFVFQKRVVSLPARRLVHRQRCRQNFPHRALHPTGDMNAVGDMPDRTLVSGTPDTATCHISRLTGRAIHDRIRREQETFSANTVMQNGSVCRPALTRPSAMSCS